MFSRIGFWSFVVLYWSVQFIPVMTNTLIKCILSGVLFGDATLIVGRTIMIGCFMAMMAFSD